MTDIRKQQNRMSFNPADSGEYGDSAMGFDQGMVGSKDTGKVRMTVKKEVSLVNKKQKKGGGGGGGGGGVTSLPGASTR